MRQSMKSLLAAATDCFYWILVANEFGHERSIKEIGELQLKYLAAFRL